MAISKAIILQLLSKFDPKGVDKATKSMDRFDKFQSKVSRRVKLGFAAAGVAATAFGQKITRVAVKAALEEDRQLTALNKTLENLGFTAATKEVAAFADDLQRASGVSDDLLRPALQSLIVTTGDVGASQELLKRALDISKGSGKDLGSVVAALNRAFSGNLTSLRRLNVGLDANLLKSGDLTTVLDILQDKFGGQTAVAAESLAGKVDRLKIAGAEATEVFGQKLIIGLENFSSDGNKALDNLGTGVERFAESSGFVLIGFLDVLKDVRTGFGLLDEQSGGFFSRIPGSFIFDYLKKRGKETEKVLVLQEELLAGREDARSLALNKQKAQSEAKFGKALKANDPLQKAALEAEKKIKEAKEKAAKKAAAEAAKKKQQEAEEKTKKALADKFDLDKINLQAALKRNLSEEDKARVKALQAIETESAKDDETALNKLITLEKLRAADQIANAEAAKAAQKSAADDAITNAQRVFLAIGGQIIEIPVRLNIIPPSGIPEGLPQIRTGLDTIEPRGASGMTLKKEAAIAARKAREAAMAAAMNAPTSPVPDDLMFQGGHAQNNTNVTVNVNGSVMPGDLATEIFNIIYGGNLRGTPSSITGT